MADTRYRAGIIGLGFIGGADQVSGDALGQQVANMDGTHAQAYAGNGRIDLVAGSSRDAGRRERFEQRNPGVTTYDDFNALLGGEQLDIVSVATYTPQHAEIVIACAAAGIPVIYCEKPIAPTLPEADAMVRACEDAGSLLVINHNRRFDPLYHEIRDRIAAGAIGELTSCAVQWPAGRLGNVGTHMFDAVCFLLGRKIVAVSGTLDQSQRPDCRGSDFTDPGGWGVLKLEDNLHCTVEAPDYGLLPPVIQVRGEQGNVTIEKTGATITFVDGREEACPRVDDGRNSMDRAVDQIVRFLDGEARFPHAAADSVKTLETIAAFHASHARSAAWVELPLTGADRQIEVNSG